MIKARIRPYFTPLGLQLREVTPQHIEDFYQSILADDCTTMKKHGSKPGQAVLMRYPHICGTVDAVQRQPTLIPLSTGIGCPDFLRSFEDMPPPPTTTTQA